MENGLEIMFSLFGALLLCTAVSVCLYFFHGWSELSEQYKGRIYSEHVVYMLK